MQFECSTTSIRASGPAWRVRNATGARCFCLRLFELNRHAKRQAPRYPAEVVLNHFQSARHVLVIAKRSEGGTMTDYRKYEPNAPWHVGYGNRHDEATSTAAYPEVGP